VRRLVVALAVLLVAGLAPAATARDERAAGAPGPLGVRVPPGWHRLRGWLSDVTDPAPRLAVASFPARLSRDTCECGFPNVVNFPPDGGFLFVWEWRHASRRGLARTPSRPARFHLAARHGSRDTCLGPSDTFGFKDAGRIFEVAVYLGPRATPAVRARLAAALDSLRAAPA
jgi:hypothetical protein